MKIEQIDLLAKEVLKHKRLYYKGTPEIEDEEYDKLEEQLKKYDPDNQVLKMVGSDFFSSKKIKHSKKMLSLDKKYEIKELTSWINQNEVVGLFKMDGSSASVIYKNGKLSLVKTRGDGEYGENITAPAIYIKSLIGNIDIIEDETEIRGEIVCSHGDFEKLSKEMIKRGLDKPKSPRNVVAGILGRKDHIDLAKYLTFYAFDLLSNIDYRSEMDKINKLEQLKFKCPNPVIINNEKELLNFIEKTKEYMSSGDFLIDGSVFIFNNLSEQINLGYTSHHPKYKMAFKFQSEGEVTALENIEWQISRFGVYTPVGIVSPVEMDGATISKVTLHNLKTVKMFNLKKEDEIKIVRSGEVIPKFLEVVNSSNHKLEIPDKCYFCNTKLKEDDVRLICENSSCIGRKEEYILNFIQKIGIDDLSGKRVRAMMNHGLIKDIPDIFKITLKDLLELPNTKERMANKLLKNIEKSKETNIIKFLSSLNFTGGARKSTELLIENGYNSWESLFSLKEENLLEIKGFAKKKAKDYIESLNENRKLISELIELGFVITFPIMEKSSNSLEGLIFCITGDLQEFKSRKELEMLIKANGGKSSSSVSSQTSYLICNEKSSSSKYKKAEDLGVTIITEKEFLEKVSNG